MQVKTLSASIILPLILLTTYTTSVWATEDCYGSPGPSGTASLRFNGPSALNIPADTPIGTVVYEETQGEFSVSFRCKTPGVFGMRVNLAIGEQPSGGHLFPIKGTGLSWQLTAVEGYELAGFIPSVPPGKILPVLPPNNAWYGWALNTSRFKLEIIKTDKSTVKTNLSAGVWGTIKANQMALVNVIMSKEIPQETLSCETPNISVAMGEYTSSDFHDNDKLNNTNYKIELLNCPRGIKTVTYALIATSPIIDKKNGIVSMNSSSSAKGVGLKLMDANGLSLELNRSYTLSDYNTAGGNLSIPLTAAYVKLQNSQIKAGTANVEVSFSISYQ
ncbi:fimbrial protein [Pseudomonas protegens]|uniref:fimbrial protein n=1 Tax=Pseudomonas protegens TaxID=380021 RepID=UPI0011CE2A40|nr:fimbrial protein [Pseudomonas protegens]